MLPKCSIAMLEGAYRHHNHRASELGGVRGHIRASMYGRAGLRSREPSHKETKCQAHRN